MQYIIMDLEWNNVYSRKKGGFFNEIIEVGAVKIDDDLSEIDSFSEFINTALGNRLQRKVRELTNISNEDINNGFGFNQVMSSFRKWIGNKPRIIMSCGTSDLYVLIENFSYFSGTSSIPFMHYYVDLQDYCASILKYPRDKQLGLAHASELLNLDIDDIELHRGLNDSIVAYECFKKTYDIRFEKFVSSCDNEFYEKLKFKPYVIKNINSSRVDRSKFTTYCPDCGNKLKRTSKWSYKNAFFRGKYYCENCEKTFKVSLRFKQYYDYVDFKKKIEEFVDKPQEDEE